MSAAPALAPADPQVGVINPAARRDDFKAQPIHVRSKIAAVLQLCAEQNMSCRVDVVGTDLYVIVGRGLSSPKHWLETFGLLPQEQRKITR